MDSGQFNPLYTGGLFHSYMLNGSALFAYDPSMGFQVRMG